MTPQQARIALGCFLLLAAGVAVNALFMQTRTDHGQPRRAGTAAAALDC
jgi:hypothetical protein